MSGESNERLTRAVRILEAMGRIAMDPEVNPFYRKYESSDDVFYHLVTILWLGFRGVGISAEDLKSMGFPTPEKIWERIKEKRGATGGFKERVDKAGGPEISLAHSITDWFALNDVRMPRMWDVALGILDIVLLWKELRDEGYDLVDLYRYHLDKFGEENAVKKLLERLVKIRGMGESRAIIFLKDYRIKSGENIPIEKLPLPVAGNVPRVMKRIGFIDSENTEKVREAGYKYFTVPVIADMGLWFIAKNYCRRDDPKCKECPIEDYCSKNI